MNTNEKEQAEQRLRQRCGRYLVAVVRAVLRGEEAPALPPELSWKNVFRMANQHSLLAMVFAGVEKQLRAEPELQSRWKQACDECLVQTLTQMSEQPRILAAFPKRGCGCCRSRAMSSGRCMPGRITGRWRTSTSLFPMNNWSRPSS